MPQTWYTPPENQGRVVEVAYGFDDGGLFERVTDRSDGSVTISRLREARDEDQPWNAKPSAA